MKKFVPVLVLLGAGMTVGISQAVAASADTAGRNRTEFSCEMGNQITVFQAPNDDKHIGLQWNNQLHELTRVTTTTGAHRFENKESGWVWISIPAKAMLLDSLNGQQLVNECMNHEQMKTRKSRI